MAEQFYTILTSIGKAKIANASVLGTKINLATLAVGDGGGKYYNPTENQETLVNEVWRGNVGAVATDSENSNWIVIETMIAGNVGGFFIREVGVFDDEGNLIAIGKYPETYKPIVSDGATKDLTIRIILEVSNASNVTLKIDPTIIMATKKDIEILDNKIKNIKIPVTKVNNKLGDVTLKAEDIKTNNDKTIEENLQEVTSQMAEIVSQEVGKGADIIGLPDPNNLFTSTNVGGAMQELFTNVSNGKSLVGAAITDVDNSLTVPTEPTFRQLAQLIGSISTGKKWAKGTAWSTNSLPVRIEVRGLTFKPSLIIASYQTNYFSIYSAELVLTHYINRQVRDTATPQKLNVLDIYDDGFRIEPAVGGGEVLHYWVAFE